ncbi:MAG: PfkB family kinase, nonfunctional [Candidatus Uhrbacteria bacterium GW2011_GWD2_52_7]|uniref:PfkB family kinase, nonfunctional n=1 Tax=Candidatus Uhrbacteria bacterium GW2011_GWD2_52_7 TaxID=1618989 RepID=A0A0G1XHB6_9BACT|nr:MAG: PfkB family kinase, nonfunctional [Candidatus Uhrbacteria bacterium GW2011_GWD2_52_7]
MFDVVTIGAATRDVFLRSREFRVMPMPGSPGVMAECVTLGSKIDIDDITYATGGGATNAAVTFARLGFSVATITRIGDDPTGKDIIDDLERNKVDTSLIKVVKKGKSAYSTLLTAMNGERTALVYRGVANDFSESDVVLTKLKTQGIYITSLAGNTALVLKVAQFAHKKGIAVAWNPGAAEIAGGRSMHPISKLMSVVLLNREEAQQLAGRKDEPKSLAKSLAVPGQTIVITDGPNGALAYRDGNAWFARTTGKPSLSRTGAGDAFGSAFVAALMRGLEPQDALRVGTVNAESVIQHVGAKAGILSAWPKAAALSAIRVRSM